MVPFSAFGGRLGNSDRLGWSASTALPLARSRGCRAPASPRARRWMRWSASWPPAGGFGFEWSGISFQERQSSGQALALYALSLLVVFLCLAALYESWSIPTAVILAVPLGVLGAVFATWAGGMSNDVYFQVGLLATIGLTAKNAILIVEFAREGFNQGASLAEAAEGRSAEAPAHHHDFWPSPSASCRWRLPVGRDRERRTPSALESSAEWSQGPFSRFSSCRCSSCLCFVCFAPVVLRTGSPGAGGQKCSR